MLTPEKISIIKELRSNKMTVGEIADFVGWPEEKSLKSFRAIVDRVSRADESNCGQRGAKS